MTDVVEYTTDGRVVTINLNRPEHMNTMGMRVRHPVLRGVGGLQHGVHDGGIEVRSDLAASRI